jgi:hypothetical protein
VIVACLFTVLSFLVGFRAGQLAYVYADHSRIQERNLAAQVEIMSRAIHEKDLHGLDWSVCRSESCRTARRILRELSAEP